MPISVREALQKSGQLDNWLGDPNPALSRERAPKAAPAPSFVSNVGKGVGALASAVGGIIAAPLGAAGNMIAGTQRNLSLDARANSAESMRKQLESRDMQVHQAYKAGKLSKDQFRAEQRKLLAEYQAVSGQAAAIGKDYYGTEQVAKDYASVAAGVLTAASPLAKVGSGVLGGVKGVGVVAKGLDAGLGASKIMGPGGIKGIPTAVAGKLTRNALVAQPTAETAINVPIEAAKGNIAGAAGNAALLAAPIGIAGVAKYAPKLGAAVSTAMYGREGFWNTVGRVGGVDMLKYHDSLTGKAKADFESTLRRVAQKKIDEVGGDPRKAAVSFVDYLEANGRDISKLTPSQWAAELRTWEKAEDAASAYGAAGIAVMGPNSSHVLKEGERVGAARFNLDDQKRVRDALATATGPEGRTAALESMRANGADFAKNPTLWSKLLDVARQSDDVWKREFEKVPALRSTYMGNAKNLPNGYIPAIMTKGTGFRDLKDTAALDRGQAAKAGFKQVGDALRKAGISTESQDPTVYRAFNANLISEFDKIENLPLPPKEVRDKLTNFARIQIGTTDERQLSVNSIKSALDGVTEAQAKAIKSAYTSAYSALSREALGTAGKIENALYKMPGFGTYRRIQGAARYELNPAFRAQETVETEILSQILSGGKKAVYPGSKAIDRIFNKGRGTDRLDDVITALKDAKVISGGGYSAFGAADNQFSKISADLKPTQLRSLAGLTDALATKAGMDVKTFLSNADDKVIDSIRLAVQYPQTGFTSSNMAKTLNMFIFPSRYTLKLAGILGKSLSNQPALVQIATVKGLADLTNYLNSDEGIKWQSDNSEVLGIIAYFNPAMNFKAFFKAVSGETPSVSDFGMIGGLPLGAVSQVLQTLQVVPKPDAAYLNPKTSEVVPDKIPATLGGGVKLAMQDLIGSMYSFPGRQLGTDLSKRQLTEGFLPFLKPDAGQVRTEDVSRVVLTEQQQRVQRVLGAKSATPTSPPSSVPVAPKPARGLILPETKVTPIYKAGTSAAPKAPRRKVYAVRPGQLR